jgi:hypothetical protein
VTGKLLRYAFAANRAERMLRSPTRYAKNRAKSKALSAVGGWSLWRRFWRA